MLLLDYTGKPCMGSPMTLSHSTFKVKVTQISKPYILVFNVVLGSFGTLVKVTQISKPYILVFKVVLGSYGTLVKVTQISKPYILVFNVGLGSFGTIVSQWPVTHND